MTSLYIDRRNADLELEGDTIVVRVDGQREGTAPLRALDRVVLRSAGRVATRLIARLAERGVGLVILSGRAGQPAAILSSTDSDAILRVAQYRLAADEHRRAFLSTQIVRSKIAAQTLLLRRHSARRPSPALKQALEAIDRASERLASTNPIPSRATLRGVEGAASAAFFRGYVTLFAPSLGFSGRNRRPPRDPVNVCLSLGYTLAHQDTVRRIVMAGLDPMIGIYHDPVRGRESLACDLVEPLRPIIERMVQKMFGDQTLEATHFSQSGAACKLGKAGRTAFYRTYEETADPMRALLDQSIIALTSELNAPTPDCLPPPDVSSAPEA